MPARPLWIVFTILVIILMEVLVVPRVIETVVAKELVSMSITMRDLESSLRELDMKVPSHIADKTARVPDDIATNDDMAHLPFNAKWRMMVVREPVKAIGYAIGLCVAGLLGGILLASVAFRHLLRFGERLSSMSSIDKIAVLIGLVIGLLITLVILPNVLPYISGPVPLVGIVIAGIVTYLSIWAMMSMKDEVKSFFPGASRAELDREFQKPKILDTNVIIDGRIADICRSGFIEGQIVVPSFILEELQHIADSEDSLKRARGRRGLDILNQMRKELNLTVRQCDLADPENREEVDARLVNLAKELDGYIVTNDFNLNKVAELQGVTVLNINELANALKPVVLPGEEMTVSVVKEGKESNQGIAYLDDGTMVVIEGGKKQIGQTVDVIVTSVLQTVAGKMIFTNLKAVQEEEDDLIGRNVRNYSGFRPRKKTR